MTYALPTIVTAPKSKLGERLADRQAGLRQSGARCVGDPAWRPHARRGRQRIKEFGRIGSRYDKTDGSFAAGVAGFLAVK